MRRLLFAGATFVACLAASGGVTVAAPLCMAGGVKGAGAQGEVSAQTFTLAGGKKETVYLLRLPLPICLSGSDKKDQVAEAGTIQLESSDAEVRKTIEEHVGKELLVMGRPFGARGPHHHAPVVMEVTKIIAE
jgi:hypothetical protein